LIAIKPLIVKLKSIVLTTQFKKKIDAVIHLKLATYTKPNPILALYN